MADKSKLESVGWSDEVEAVLAVAQPYGDPDDPGADLGFYRDLVKAGKAGVLGAIDGSKLVAAAVYVVEPGAIGMELVLVSAGSIDARYDLIDEHLKTIEYLALAMGARSVRFHTKRAGLVRKMAEQGYRLSERVYRKSIGRAPVEPVRHECRVQDSIQAKGGGGGSSSSTTTQTDERIAADSSIVADDHGQVTLNIEDITPEIVAEVGDFASRVFDFAETERDASRDLQRQALDRAFDSTNAGVQELLSDMIKLTAGAAAAYAAVRYGPDLIKSMKG
jgi:hypothetical protein